MWRLDSTGCHGSLEARCSAGSAGWMRLLILLLALIGMVCWMVAANPVQGEETKGQGVAGSIKPPNAYEPAKPDQYSARGKQLFKQHNCAVCHSIAGTGGCLGPPLEGVGSRRSKDFLLTRLSAGPQAEEKFSRIYGPELLAHPRFPQAAAHELVAYLLTLSEPAKGFRIGKHAPAASQATIAQGAAAGGDELKKHSPVADQAAVSEGKKLFFDHGCAACHSIGQIGGQFAPALDGISQRKDRQGIEAQISGAEILALSGNSEYAERGTVMPPSNLSASEVSKIATFLLSLPPGK